MGAQCEIKETPLGFPVVEGIEQYEDACCRDKVIVRVDVLSGLTKMFSESILKKYRAVVFRLIAGLYSKESVPDVMETLFYNDNKFQAWLGEVYYFTQELYKKSVWQVFVEEARSLYDKVVKNIVELNSMGYAYESCGYIYFAVKDSCDTKFKMLKGISSEVYSCAKVWSGNIQEA